MAGIFGGAGAAAGADCATGGAPAFDGASEPPHAVKATANTSGDAMRVVCELIMRMNKTSQREWHQLKPTAAGFFITMDETRSTPRE
jgi:hypothetical protein